MNPDRDEITTELNRKGIGVEPAAPSIKFQVNKGRKEPLSVPWPAQRPIKRGRGKARKKAGGSMPASGGGESAI